jgi:excinuclease ABC subunit B
VSFEAGLAPLAGGQDALVDVGGGQRHRHAAELAGMPAADLAQLIQQLSEQMRAAAEELQFELAARLRDEIAELKRELRAMHEAGVGR